jgi:hypothetical protein
MSTGSCHDSATPSPSSANLIQVCGFPSGGTDLVRNFLSSHPAIEVGGELPLLPTLARQFRSRIHGRDVERFRSRLVAIDAYRSLRNPDADLADLGGLSSVAVATIYHRLAGTRATLWRGNKTPQMTERLDDLLTLFPEIRVVLVVRDVRDVCLSSLEKWGRDPVLRAHKWTTRLLSGLSVIERLPPEHAMILKFEDLLYDCEDVAKEVCRFLGLPLSDRMLRHHETVSTANPGHKNFGRPIDPGNLGRWRTGLTTRQILRIEGCAYEAMRRFGYRPEFATCAVPLTPRERAVGMARDAATMVLVGNRYDPRDGVTRRLRSLALTMRRRLDARRMARSPRSMAGKRG